MDTSTLPTPTIRRSPYAPGGHTHAYVFTCRYCLRAAVYVRRRFGGRSVLRLAEAAARTEGWSKGAHGWIHKRCRKLERLHLAPEQEQLPPAPPPEGMIIFLDGKEL